MHSRVHGRYHHSQLGELKMGIFFLLLSSIFAWIGIYQIHIDRIDFFMTDAAISSAFLAIAVYAIKEKL